MALVVTYAQRAELRRIAMDSPPAIRRRLLDLLTAIGQGQATTLDRFAAPAEEVAA